MLKNIFQDIKQAPKNLIYWIEGEENYLIDACIEFFETQILNETEKQFDYSVFYGKETTFEQVYNACRQAPMFAQNGLVIIKEAQAFKDIKKLEKYFLQKQHISLLVIAYKGKLDARTSFSKVVKQRSKILNFPLLKSVEIGKFINEFIIENGFKIKPVALSFLIELTGNNLTLIVNELKKVFVHHDKNTVIDKDEIAELIGINKEYNIFELQKAFEIKDKKKVATIINYMAQNSKEHPFIVLNVQLYNFFSKILICLENINIPETDLARMTGMHPYYIKDFKKAVVKSYTIPEVDKNLLILHEYNLKALGINTSKISEENLKKELVMKLLI